MDGVYELTLTTPMGPISGKLGLQTKGEELNGIIEIMGSRNNITGGKVQGNKCFFSGDFKNQVVNLKYDITGELVNNTLNIVAKTNMGEFQLKGKKIG